MRFRRTVGAAALAAAAVISSTVPAAAASAAGTACGHSVASPDHGALACFIPTGEILRICDTNDDGHHPGAWYLLNTINWHNVQYNLGAGKCHDLDLDLPETASIEYQACNYEGSTQLSCSPYAIASAKG